MSSAAADGPSSMTNVTCQLSISLDGYVAGPNQSAENPIGEGGMQLHHWAFETASWREQQGLSGGQDDVDSQVAAEVMSGIGAFVMGRHMFDPGRGAWDESWRGWWGEDPPYHAPVFVLTHHPRESLVMEGGTTFHFVTDGIESALKQARKAAGDGTVSIAGGASVARQYLRAGLIDELHLHVTPVVLGTGERLLDDVGTPALEQVEVRSSPVVTHIRYRVVRD
jgi:dihydrofolate reductase